MTLEAPSVDWRRTTAILAVCQFLVYGSMMMVLPLLPAMLQTMGITERGANHIWATHLFAANFLTAFCVAPFWGRLADRLGKKPMILRSGFSMAVVIGLMGFADSPWQLLALRLFNGILSGFIPASVALIAFATPPQHRLHALGLLQAGTVGGALVGPAIGGWLLSVLHLDFLPIFLLTSAMVFLATCVVGVMVRERKQPPGLAAVPDGVWSQIARLLRQKELGRLFLIAVLFQSALSGPLALLPALVGEFMGETSYGKVALEVGWVSGLTLLATVISSALLGKYGDPAKPLRLLMVMLGLAGVAMGLQGVVTVFWLFLLLRVLLGFSVGGIQPALSSLVGRFAPRAELGAAYGLQTSANALGNVFGPSLWGILAACMSSVQGVFLASSLCFGLACLLAGIRFPLPEEEKSAPP